MSKVKYTKKDIISLNNACDVLDVITENSLFENLVADSYGKDVSVEDVRKILYNINIMKGKINDGIKAENADGTKKEAFFTKEIPSTSRSRMLQSVVSDVDLRFPDEDSTCQTDVRAMLYSYINKNELRDEEKGVRIDKRMRNLAPNTFRDMDYIPRSDRKSIPNAVMEILK